MFKIVACMLGAAVLSLSAAGAETGVSTAGEALLLQEDGLEPRLGVPAGRRPRKERLADGASAPYVQPALFHVRLLLHGGAVPTERNSLCREEWLGQKVFSDCGAAFQVAEVTVNGKAAERHEGGYTAFRTDLTPFLKPERIGWKCAWTTAGILASPRGPGEHTFPAACTGTASARVFPVHIRPTACGCRRRK